MRGIPCGQALRIKRICSKTADCLHHIKELKGYLTDCGYHEEVIKQQLNRATRLDRNLLSQTTQRTTNQVVPLVVTYHPDLPHLKGILERHRPIIDISE